mmetsp:Transcript_10919/g.15629  ORF Transcript_10919/g.15629 Transcript_10919/m.15629 type:complete len:420 (+) Transcript_10919:35-1294(+)
MAVRQTNSVRTAVGVWQLTVVSLVLTSISIVEALHSTTIIRNRNVLNNRREIGSVSLKASEENIVTLEEDQREELGNIERIYCLSDLHSDHSANLQWLKDEIEKSSLCEKDLIIVAGDISHDYDRFRETIQILQSKDSTIAFCSGNHEAWITGSEASSYQKLARIEHICRQMGVFVDAVLIQSAQHPVWIVPLHSWYDATLSLPHSDALCTDFSTWPWADFRRCKWPNHTTTMDGTNAKIPVGLADFFHQLNIPSIQKVTDSRSNRDSIISFSHFLPNQQCLPDWKELSAIDFNSQWLDHGAPGTSAKFAKVAGSETLHHQIIDLGSTLHVFGHSHRPKDFIFKGTRFVHNPLGSPRERLIHMVSPDVTFLQIWDTRIGQLQGKQVLRLWEEQGGGIDALKTRLAIHGKRKIRNKNRII